MSLFCFLREISPSSSVSALKGKNLLLWEQILPFRVEPNEKGGKMSELLPFKVYAFT